LRSQSLSPQETPFAGPATGPAPPLAIRSSALKTATRSNERKEGGRVSAPLEDAMSAKMEGWLETAVIIIVIVCIYWFVPA
jgi:hypothetical protein